ncbi:MAG: hypothetical protein CBC83_00135 [Flavobacteriales bacterium TMED123]|nr:MAG: hypothetical protein CBC83_00135 [Flavobacteriales bacterium TMED123]|tara:strand:- start:460 stop:966 length:507 start_codon:yes stop_codon:yes gene_type:complete
MAKNDDQPISKIQWVKRETLKPNSYNPNRVASPELKLLKISILEDGWTQPIVANSDNEIVDGFHRWTVSKDPKIAEMTDGLIPVVFTAPKNASHQKMSTIRHNRARGTHAVLDMSEIIQQMVEDGVSKQEIMERLQMEEEEVIRLASRAGIPASKLINETDFSKAWVV